MKIIIILALLIAQPSTQVYHMNKGLIGGGSWRTTTVPYSRTLNIDSLTDKYDTVKVYTNHGLKLYVR